MPPPISRQQPHFISVSISISISTSDISSLDSFSDVAIADRRNEPRASLLPPNPLLRPPPTAVF